MKIYIIQFVNYTLSFFMWMILGRVILGLIIGNRDNFAVGLFAKVTEPIYRAVRKIMPFAKESCIPFIAFFLVLILRLLLIIAFSPATAKR